VASLEEGVIAALLLVVLSGSTGCDVEDESTRSRPLELWLDPSGTHAVIPLADSDLLSVGVDSGAVAFRYRHVRTRNYPVFQLPPSRLVCPPEWAGPGLVYLVYTDALVALAPDTATVRWRMPIRVPMPRAFCPAASPDSGLVTVSYRGHGLNKLGPDGNELWSYVFPDGAVASTGPRIVGESGNIWIRARSVLFSLSPDGHLNWEHPVVP
jgi:hypothetical protein